MTFFLRLLLGFFQAQKFIVSNFTFKRVIGRNHFHRLQKSFFASIFVITVAENPPMSPMNIKSETMNSCVLAEKHPKITEEKTSFCRLFRRLEFPPAIHLRNWVSLHWGKLEWHLTKNRKFDLFLTKNHKHFILQFSRFDW